MFENFEVVRFLFEERIYVGLPEIVGSSFGAAAHSVSDFKFGDYN